MIKNQDKVSVIMSVYNSEKTLSKSIESILSQTFQNFEFLILDDGSYDDSIKILYKLQKNDDRIKIFRNETNQGLTKSLNYLISNSSGTFLARQDADDISHNSRIENQLQFIEKYQLDACTTRALGMETRKTIPNLSYYLPIKFVLKYKNPFIHGTLLIKKATMDSIGCYDENFYYSQDYKLMKDLVSKNKKIKIMKKVLYDLNQSNNISTNNYEKQKYYADCIKKT